MIERDFEMMSPANVIFILLFFIVIDVVRKKTPINQFSFSLSFYSEIL